MEHDRATAWLLIKRWDVNNDGELSYEELATWVLFAVLLPLEDRLESCAVRSLNACGGIGWFSRVASSVDTRERINNSTTGTVRL